MNISREVKRMRKHNMAALVAVIVLLAASAVSAGFRINSELPLKYADAKAGVEAAVKVEFAEGAAYGAWKSVEGKTSYDKGQILVRLAYDGDKLACVQTEYAVSMNDFMTYDWYAYGDFHGKLFKAATGLDDVKFAESLNKLMDEIYGKIMGQYRGEIYYQMPNGILAGVRLKTGQGGVLNIFYYLNEPMLNDDGGPRTDMRFFELK